MTKNIIRAILSWTRDPNEKNNICLYVGDPQSMFWAQPTTIEEEIVKRDGAERMGDRYLVVRIGNRHIDPSREQHIINAIDRLLVQDELKNQCVYTREHLDEVGSIWVCTKHHNISDYDIQGELDEMPCKSYLEQERDRLD